MIGTVSNLDVFDFIDDLHAAGVVADAIVTDPPYASGGLHIGARRRPTTEKYGTQEHAGKLATIGFSGDAIDQRTWMSWCQRWLTGLRAVCRDDGAVLACFVDWRQLPALTDCVQLSGWSWAGVLPWCKTNSRPRYGWRQSCEFVVWATAGVYDRGSSYAGHFEHPPPSSSKRLHPTEKPQPVLGWLMEPFPVGSLIVDPFCGSGSTLLAARDTGMRWIGSDYDVRWSDMSRERLAVPSLALVPEDRAETMPFDLQ